MYAIGSPSLHPSIKLDRFSTSTSTKAVTFKFIRDEQLSDFFRIQQALRAFFNIEKAINRAMHRVKTKVGYFKVLNGSLLSPIYYDSERVLPVTTFLFN